jgi:hypothetical protein
MPLRRTPFTVPDTRGADAAATAGAFGLRTTQGA